jgi:hypothetical protein
LFNFEMFFSAEPQAVRAAWVNIWGVRRVCGTPIMFNVLFASYALVQFFVLREFDISKKFHRSLFDLLVEVSVCCVARENWCACAAQYVPVRPPSALA